MEACLPGHDDAPHKVRLSYYGDSMVDSNCIVSRSNDSGVDLEGAGAAQTEAAGPSNANGKQYKDSHLKPPGRTHMSLRDSRKPLTTQGDEGKKELKMQSTDVSNLSSDRPVIPDSARRASQQPTRPPPPKVAHRGSIPIIILPPDDFTLPRCTSPQLLQ